MQKTFYIFMKTLKVSFDKNLIEIDDNNEKTFTTSIIKFLERLLSNFLIPLCIFISLKIKKFKNY